MGRMGGIGQIEEGVKDRGGSISSARSTCGKGSNCLREKPAKGGVERVSPSGLGHPQQQCQMKLQRLHLSECRPKGEKQSTVTWFIIERHLVTTNGNINWLVVHNSS